MDRRRHMIRSEKAKTILEICRGSQVAIGIIILTLSISLSVRWDNLAHGCNKSSSRACTKTDEGVGGLKYSISVGAFALFDVGLWAVDTFWLSLPWWLVYGSAQLCGGLALGGGCTLAALINGWNCEKGESADLRMCHAFYADMAFMYVQVLIAWGGLFAWCYVKKHYRPDIYSRMS